MINRDSKKQILDQTTLCGKEIPWFVKLAVLVNRLCKNHEILQESRGSYPILLSTFQNISI